MFNTKGRDGLSDAKDPAGKAMLKPAIYDPPGSPSKAIPPAPPRHAATSFVPAREGIHPPAHVAQDESAHHPAASASTGAIAATHSAHAAHAAETPGSKLFVGVNIKLKGVEISDCDVLVIEGHVEATVRSKVMEIAKPGTLTGTALIDIAEIHGEFSGELTASTRLIVHGTGRVSGTIRYGHLVVADGGEVSGDVKRVDGPDHPAPAPSTPHTGRGAGSDARYRASGN